MTDHNEKIFYKILNTNETILFSIDKICVKLLKQYKYNY